MTTDTRSDDFLRPSANAGGVKLRPLSSGSYALLHRTGNAFVVPASGQPDHLAAALEYAYIHGAPLDAVMRAAYSPIDVFRSEVFLFAQAIPVSGITAIIREVEAGLTAAAAQSVDVVSRPGTEDKDAPPNS